MLRSTVRQGIRLARWKTKPISRRGAVKRLAAEPHLSGIGLLQPGEQAQQRALAAARGADDGQELPLLRRQRQVVQREQRRWSRSEKVLRRCWLRGSEACDHCGRKSFVNRSSAIDASWIRPISFMNAAALPRRRDRRGPAPARPARA